MFYTFRDEAENITVEEARACDFSLGYIGISEFDEVGRLLICRKSSGNFGVLQIRRMCLRVS